jgi:hypothetical protein
MELIGLRQKFGGREGGECFEAVSCSSYLQPPSACEVQNFVVKMNEIRRLKPAEVEATAGFDIPALPADAWPQESR